MLHFEKKEAQFTRIVGVQRPPWGHLNKQAIPPHLPPHRGTQKQGWEQRSPWAPHHLSGKALMKVSARNFRSLLQALSSVGMGTASLLCAGFLSALSLFLSLSSCAWIGLSTLSICSSPSGGEVDLNTGVWTPEVLPPPPCPEPASPGAMARFSKLGNQRAYLKDTMRLLPNFCLAPCAQLFLAEDLSIHIIMV